MKLRHRCCERRRPAFPHRGFPGPKAPVQRRGSTARATLRQHSSSGLRHGSTAARRRPGPPSTSLHRWWLGSLRPRRRGPESGRRTNPASRAYARTSRHPMTHRANCWWCRDTDDGAGREQPQRRARRRLPGQSRSSTPVPSCRELRIKIEPAAKSARSVRTGSMNPGKLADDSCWQITPYAHIKSIQSMVRRRFPGAQYLNARSSYAPEEVSK